jgi:hypothetical protein
MPLKKRAADASLIRKFDALGKKALAVIAAV